MSNDRSPAELDTDFAAFARLAEANDELTTLLHIGDEHLVLLSGLGPVPETVQRFDLGAARIARGHFRHDPPDISATGYAPRRPARAMSARPSGC